MAQSKEEIAKNKHIYYINNKEKILQRNKENYKNFYDNNQDKLKESSKLFYHKNKEKILECQRQRKQQNWKKYLLSSCKQRSIKSGLEFNICEEDIVIPDICPYLGTKITFEQNKERVMTNPSVDRIDNTKGYVKGNIQVISKLANYMKFTASEEQLIAFAEGVLRLHKGKV